MHSGNKNNDKKNTRIRPVWYVVFAVIVIAIVFAVVAKWPKHSEGGASVNVVGIETEIKTIEETRAIEKTYVKIDLESCKVVVGTKFIVTATVTPANTEKALQWKTNDEKVFKVSKDGIIEITGEGTAALTATVGDVSDSIIIEGVASADSKSRLDLPGYDEAVKGTNGDDGQNPQPNKDEQGSNSEQKETASQGTMIPGQTMPVQTIAPTQSVPVEPPTVVSRGLRSYDLPEVLADYGYKGTGNNVYTYGEGDSYAGEIIVQPNLTIIYIKKNTGDFENAIQNVLTELLPDDHGQAWGNYVSASTDRTFTLEGRMVRIVTAGNGGHSQIVVYN